MEKIFEYLDGIENCIQRLHLQTTEEHVDSVKAIINTARILKKEFLAMQQKINDMSQELESIRHGTSQNDEQEVHVDISEDDKNG